MIPGQFQYLRPGSLEEAVKLLSTLPEAKILAGGHSLIPLMKLRLVSPQYLIDIGRIPGLSYVREEGGRLCIGALTTHAEVEASGLIRTRLPLLAEAAGCIGDPQVRNRGTIGGSLSHADPAADLPAVMQALDAEMLLQGPSGRRAVAAGEFFLGVLATALEPQEMLVEIGIPTLPAHTGTAYLKVPHKASYFAVVGVAAALTLAADGTCQAARIGVTGLAERAFRAVAAEAALTGRPVDDAAVQAAAERVAEGVEPLSDIYASAEYRMHLARVYTARAVRLALERARA